MGWRQSAMSYASAQLQHRLLPTLTGDCSLDPELSVVMERPQGGATLLCAPPKPRFAGLRIVAAMLVQFLGQL
jgi:hypothetical protein